MANAKRDENHVPTLIAALNTNGTTIVPVCSIASTHRLCVSDGTSGTDHGTTNALRDENSVRALLAVSSADGRTPVAVYADSSGHLLINSM